MSKKDTSHSLRRDRINAYPTTEINVLPCEMRTLTPILVRIVGGNGTASTDSGDTGIISVLKFFSFDDPRCEFFQCYMQCLALHYASVNFVFNDSLLA